MKKYLAIATTAISVLGTGLVFGNNYENGQFVLKKNEKDACVLEDVATAGLGDVKYSILSETDFQSVNGAGWVLMKGQTKTDLGITTEASVFDYMNAVDNTSTTQLPDARGRFMRAHNQGIGTTLGNPDGDVALGINQIESNKHLSSFQSYSSFGGGVGTINIPTDGTPSAALYTGSNGGTAIGLLMWLNTNESRPKNTTVNVFVKVKQNCLDDVATTHRNSNSTRLDTAETFINQSTCDTCINMVEGTLAEQQAKLACQKVEIDAYEADNAYWNVSCTARSVGHAKRVLMLIGAANRTQVEDDFLTHLDNQYPFYNVIETSFE